jgi:glycosyltransferase involved in cell wall biosynthesis
MRTVESCPYRADVRVAEGVELASCGLLQQVSDLAVSMSVRRDACESCCATPVPTPTQINPVIASHLSRITSELLQDGNSTGGDLARATALRDWARLHMRTVSVAGATNEGTSRRSPGDLPSVAIVIPCHNYGRVLGEAIESALAQTIASREILVVDDASDDETEAVASRFESAGVRYLRVDHRDVYRTRLAGLDATTAEILCFLDADDSLPPEYLERGLPLFDDPSIGVVYSDVEYFGDRSGRTIYPEFDPVALEFDNYLHAGSLVRRRALEISNAYSSRQISQTHADWFVWRCIVECGWRGAKQPALYRYRQHAGSMFHRFRWQRKGYYELASLATAEITIVTALAGRKHLWDSYRQWLLAQSWPVDQCRLILMDTSGDAEFGLTVRRFLAECPYRDTRYIARVVARRDLADMPRRENVDAVRLACARIYNHLAQEIRTPFALVVEDDIIPPTGVVDQLLRAFDPRTAAVGAPYRSRFHRGYVAWDHQIRHVSQGDGVQVVGGCGFGCILIRRAALGNDAFGFGFREPEDFDHAFCRRIARKGWTIKIDWSQICLHHGSQVSPDSHQPASP